MTTKEAAALWGCSWETVKKLVRSGRIDGAYKVGYTWIIPDWAVKPPLLPRGRHDWARRGDVAEPVAPAPVREDRAVLRSQAADALADILLAEPGAAWARFALEAVLKQPTDRL